MAKKLPKTTTDEQKLVFETRTPVGATKRDARQLAKTVHFRRVGWCAGGGGGGGAIAVIELFTYNPKWNEKNI